MGKDVVIKTRIIVRYRIWFVIMSDNKKTGKPGGTAVHEKEQTIRIMVVVVLYYKVTQKPKKKMEK